MKDFTIKLRTKFTISIILVVLFFGTINILLIRGITKKAMLDELDKRGLYIAKNIAEQITYDLLHEDLLSIQQKIDGINYLTKDVSYAFVLSKDNQVIAHNFVKPFPIELISANRIERNKAYKYSLIVDKKRNITYRDLAFPLLDGELGTVRVGLSEIIITRGINKVVGIFTFMVLAFLFIGILAAFVFAYRITSPISKIINGFENLNFNKDISKININTHDEIAILGNKFNHMAERLQTTHKELTEAQNKLIHTEKLAAIGTLVSGIVHEVNNPLAGLKNCMNRIKKKPEPEEFLKYFKLMTDASDKIEYVIKGLLDFSRKSSIENIPVDINKTIVHSLDLTQAQLSYKSIDLILDVPENIGFCLGDHHQLEQVLMNLLLNSIDSMPDGGSLCLSSYKKDGYIYISIEDSGTGIKKEHLANIFDPFFTTKEVGKGTGLGLPISSNFIQAHGGDIQVESVVNRGTKITISLPEYSLPVKE